MKRHILLTPSRQTKIFPVELKETSQILVAFALFEYPSPPPSQKEKNRKKLWTLKVKKQENVVDAQSEG